MLFRSYIAYFITGCYCGVYYKPIKEFIKRKFKILLLVFIFSYVIDTIFGYKNYSLHEDVLWLKAFRVIFNFAAIFFVYTLALFITEKLPSKAIGIIKTFSNSCFYVYLSHCFWIFIINEAMKRLKIEKISTAFAIRFAFVYSITIASCVLYSIIKARINKRILMKKQI